MHFISLRIDDHAQYEIRQYAKTIGEQIVKPLFPLVWEAFEDYRLDGMFLTKLDIEAVSRYLTGVDTDPVRAVAFIDNKRERNEALNKLNRLIMPNLHPTRESI